ncbi:MAG: hypothetical protein JJU19_10940 [Pararhodobacter sp.]|nr:hypothetical protein [Pararhodobacter sp.]
MSEITMPPSRPGGLFGAIARESLAPWLYLAPALLALIMWIYAPLGYALWLSFHEWNMLPFVPNSHRRHAEL